MEIYSIDYHDVKSRYSTTRGWEEIPGLLKYGIEILLKSQPNCLIIANNTLHKAFDLIGDGLELPVPWLHVVSLAKEEVISRGYKRILLLGTRFTMEDEYFKVPLIANGIDVVVPNEQQRNEIQRILAALSQGDPTSEHLEFFSELAKCYSHLDAFIIACSELPLIRSDNS